MKRKIFVAAALVVVFAVSAVGAYQLLTTQNSAAVRVACVGDSLTQNTAYPYDMWMLLGNQSYDLRNFGAGGTTVNLASETPYMNTSVYQDALNYSPDIVLIMLGTNDAQPSLVPYNTTFVSDYITLIRTFQNLPVNPKIWVVLPPPVYSSQGGKMNPEFFASTLIPDIQQAAQETGVPTIDVYSQMVGHPEYSTDGVHLNEAGAKVVADTVYTAIAPSLSG